MQYAVITLVGWVVCASIAAAQAGGDWRLAARYGHAAQKLALDVCSRKAQDLVMFRLPGDAAATSEPPLRTRGEFVRVRGGWQASLWRAGECAQFEVDLARAAQPKQGRRRGGTGAADALLVAPQQWLWLPDSRGRDATIEFELAQGLGVSVPWRRLPDVEGRPTYALGADPLDGPALTAFGAFDERILRKPGGVLRAAVLAPPRSALATRLHQWIDGVAGVALTANDRLPLRDAQILVVPIAGSGEATPWGEVQRGGGSALHLYPGSEASLAILRADWTATHEIAHLFHPYLGTRGRWLGEGLASYYQNVLRARAGWLTVEDAVAKLRAGFRRGQREGGTAGMTPAAASQQMHQRGSFMRVYWSGAAYWLGVDARLRRAHASSLDAVLAKYSECCLEGGDVARPERFIAELDRLSGTRVFSIEFERASRATNFPDPRELDALLDDPKLRAAIFSPRTRP